MCNLLFAMYDVCFYLQYLSINLVWLHALQSVRLFFPIKISCSFFGLLDYYCARFHYRSWKRVIVCQMENLKFSLLRLASVRFLNGCPQHQIRRRINDQTVARRASFSLCSFSLLFRTLFSVLSCKFVQNF